MVVVREERCKLLPYMTGIAKVSHLPALISKHAGIDQLLEVLCLPDGTGEITVAEVVAASEDWGIKSGICGMAFDTTLSNEYMHYSGGEVGQTSAIFGLSASYS